MKKSNSSQFFDREVSPVNEKYIQKNLDISMQVTEYLDELGWTQKEFADKMGKSESEISKWLSGMHNLTLKSIAKMEAVLGRDIILTPHHAKKHLFSGINLHV